MVLASNAIFWIYVYSDSVGIIRDRTNDLSLIVAEENCLSPAYIDSYNELLMMSETPWLKFPDRTGAYANRPYSVTLHGSAAMLYSYDAAPQRGSAIDIALTGNISLPFFIGMSSSGSGGLTNDRASLDFSITQNYIVMGLKFYKDKV